MGEPPTWQQQTQIFSPVVLSVMYCINVYSKKMFRVLIPDTKPETKVILRFLHNTGKWLVVDSCQIGNGSMLDTAQRHKIRNFHGPRAGWGAYSFRR